MKFGPHLQPPLAPSAIAPSMVEQALQTLRRVRNAFAHSTTTATLADPSHADRVAQANAAARDNSLWQPLERILQGRWAVMAPHWIQPCGTTSC